MLASHAMDILHMHYMCNLQCMQKSHKVCLTRKKKSVQKISYQFPEPTRATFLKALLAAMAPVLIQKQYNLIIETMRWFDCCFVSGWVFLKKDYTKL